MTLSSSDIEALLLTFRLALTVTIILLVLGTPIAWSLARTRAWWKAPVSALIAMPLILPPTVIGFYLLLLLGPNGPIGRLTETLGIGILPFTFTGLVIASIIYSLPFVVQPILNAMQAIPSQQLEAAATLKAGPLDRFFNIVIPQSLSGIVTAGILGFAHTVGEFGVILMIGGNIPGETRVASIQIYDHVESINYANAHGLSLTLLIFSFVILLILYSRAKFTGLRFGR